MLLNPKFTSVIELTSEISFKAVSQPNENSVPGTLLLIVAGIIAIGILNSSYLSLALKNVRPV